MQRIRSTMPRISRRTWLISSLAVVAVPFVGLPGCTSNSNSSTEIGDSHVVRVKLLQDQTLLTLCASGAPLLRSGTQGESKRLDLGAGVPVKLTNGRWRVGTVDMGSGVVVINPGTGPLTVNGSAYRGNLRLLPTSAGKFDVVNDVDIDGYLKSVLSKELLRLWDDQTYMAQAIVARTYALYELRTAGAGRDWDIYADQRSQVYGGLDAETSKSRAAVEATRGVVVAYGLPGKEKIFKAYFSSCCGGVTQSVTDAFGEPWTQPLGDRNNGSQCNASPRFNWAPVTIPRAELTRRFRLWGAKKNRSEQNMADLTRLDVSAVNRFGRPVRFLMTDARGTRYSWTGEEMRWAVNTDAPDGSRTTLYSSFCRIINDDATQSVRFVDGHGHGHGVGMCQWCAQAMADAGLQHEDIVIRSFPGARLARAY